MTTELTDNEKQLLAREIAADKRVGAGGYYNDNMRQVFVSGWNAAMEYVEKQRINSCTAEMEIDLGD